MKEEVKSEEIISEQAEVLQDTSELVSEESGDEGNEEPNPVSIDVSEDAFNAMFEDAEEESDGFDEEDEIPDFEGEPRSEMEVNIEDFVSNYLAMTTEPSTHGSNKNE